MGVLCLVPCFSVLSSFAIISLRKRELIALFRPNKKISVLRVMGLKILGRVNILFYFFSFWI